MNSDDETDKPSVGNPFVIWRVVDAPGGCTKLGLGSDQVIDARAYRDRSASALDDRARRAKLAAVVRLFGVIYAEVAVLMEADRWKTGTIPPRTRP